MRRLLVLILASLLLNASTAQASAVVGATEFTQLANHVELVLQYAQQVQAYIRQGLQLEQEIATLAEMVRNGRALPAQIFGPITQDIQALAHIVQGGRALAYSLGDLDAQFRQRFQGYGYQGQEYLTHYRDWSQTSLDTTLGALRAAGLQGAQLQNEQTVLARLRDMAQSADGHMQAIQVTNEIAEQQVQQLMKLRQLMITDMTAKNAFMAQQTQREMATAAGTERFFQYRDPTQDAQAFRGGSH